MTARTDGHLVARIQDGDLEALGELYEKYKTSVYRTALAITRDEKAAEDILQETFLRVYTYAHSIDQAVPLGPWLYRVTVNLAYSWARRAKRWLRSLQDILDRWALPSQWHPETLAEEEEWRRTLQQAVDAGCVAVVAEIDDAWSRERIEALNTAIPVIVAGKVHAGRIAARFYADPSARLTIIGYTGTNGKTTCAWLTAGVLENCAMIGTLGNGAPGSLQQATHTTPDAITLQQMFADYLQTGITAVAMEVSSHALDQERVDGTHIDVAVFTNLSRDHLDYHGTMQAYGEAKQKLFCQPDLSCVVINMDDPYGQQIRESLAPEMRCITVGVNAADVQLRASHIRQTQQGLQMVLHYGQQQVVLESPLIGRFNVDNLLSVAGALVAAGVPLVQLVKRLSSVPAVPGRMERFGGENQPLVVVDYAHTPDALKNALLAAREHTQAELICLFGCGGDRDAGKRPLMGAVAEELADRVIVTDDNPRSESTP